MADSEFSFRTIGEVSSLIANKDVSPVELTEAHLERIEALDQRINAYITLLPEEAMASARRAEEAIARGDYLGPLHGIPIALKDLYYTKGIKTTAGSKILQEFVPQYDATVVERLNNAGAILLGKLHMHEFAAGGIQENYFYGPCRNPWDLSRETGGSSSGSGAAVAASMCMMALGSDTGGSVRIPAALCGIVGLKPTFGLVSRLGVVPLSWSLDHVGPMARSVEDVALSMNVMAGHDPQDPSSADIPVPDYTRALQQDIRGLRLGIPKEYFFDIIDPEVSEAFNKAVAVLEELGASTEEVSLSRAQEAQLMYQNICFPEMYTFHEQWAKSRWNDYGPNVRMRLEQASLIPAIAYLDALRLRGLLVDEFRQAFQRVDAILVPTTTVPAPEYGSTTFKFGDREEPALGLTARHTRVFNLSGVPALALPCGFSSHGLPLSLHIGGRPFQEETVLRIGHAYEQSTQWHTRRPEL